MVVTTKYNIGDTVWFISNDKVSTLDITGFNITVDSGKTVIKYNLHYDVEELEEELLFPTKEELLKSL